MRRLLEALLRRAGHELRVLSLALEARERHATQHHEWVTVTVCVGCLAQSQDWEARERCPAWRPN